MHQKKEKENLEFLILKIVNFSTKFQYISLTQYFSISTNQSGNIENSDKINHNKNRDFVCSQKMALQELADYDIAQRSVQYRFPKRSRKMNQNHHCIKVFSIRGQRKNKLYVFSKHLKDKFLFNRIQKSTAQHNLINCQKM